MNNIALIILAAGNSSRLGQPKQLLVFNQKTLLQHTIDEALAANIHKIVLVTGAQNELLKNAIPNNNIVFVHNQNWQTGMAGSMQTGLNAATNLCPTLDAVLFSVSDQPFVSKALFEQLVNTFLHTHNIVAAQYNNTIGTPALFPKKYFNHLAGLTGQQGAKKLLLQHASQVSTIPFENGEIDIDTPEQYDELISKFGI